MSSKTPPTNETFLVNQILEALSAIPGVLVWRNNTGAYKVASRFIRYGLCPGSSDVIGLANGRFLALEVKTPIGKVTEDQERFLAAVNTNGGIGRVVRSVAEAKEVVLREV